MSTKPDKTPFAKIPGTPLEVWWCAYELAQRKLVGANADASVVAIAAADDAALAFIQRFNGASWAEMRQEIETRRQKK
jgi:hypothetical protein